jgi:hypothetical protein
MSRPKITIVGLLRWTEEYGLGGAVLEVLPNRITPDRIFYGHKLDEGTNYWFEPSISFDWRTSEERPKKPPKGTFDDWIKLSAPWYRARSDNPSYRRAALEFVALQNREPQVLQSHHYIPDWNFALWCYKGKVLKFEMSGAKGLNAGEATEALLIKHFVLRRERQYERVRREVEALENVEKLQDATREPIPDSVRLFVWQRDKGQCVKCGSHEKLEFDHIIPIAAGGSNTERNVQLLCEACNRSKGATI